MRTMRLHSFITLIPEVKDPVVLVTDGISATAQWNAIHSTPATVYHHHADLLTAFNTFLYRLDLSTDDLYLLQLRGPCKNQ